MIETLALAKKVADSAESSMPKPLRQALLNLIGPFTKEAGLILAIPFQFWRFRASISLLEKAKAFLNARQVKPEQVPLKFLSSILEHGSLEDDETMIDRWASLLAAAADPTYKTTVLPGFAHILNELSPKEAQLLESAYGLVLSRIKGDSVIESVVVYCGQFLSEIAVSEVDLAVLLENLHRLRLIELSANPRYAWPPGTPLGRPHDRFCITRLGAAFMTACGQKIGQEAPDANNKQLSYREPGSRIEFKVGPVTKKSKGHPTSRHRKGDFS